MPRTDLVIIPKDEPGVLANMAQVLGDAGVNVEACSAFTGGGKGVVHLLVNQPDRAIEVLGEAGYEVKAARRVAVAKLENKPGTLAAACHAVEEAGVNIEQCYFAADNELVIVCDDVDAAKQALGIID
jgi:hypothetical protein